MSETSFLPCLTLYRVLKSKSLLHIMTISTITCYTADIVQLHKPFVFKVCHYKPLFENSVEIFIGGDLTDLLNLGYI